jgi:hypothetical protein
MAHWFHQSVVETGRLPLFCFFAATIVTFAFIRFSVRMIRAGVRWWPGNLEPGGLHIHHAVFGVVFMVVGGIAGISLPDRATVGLCITSSLFGVGTALVLDEFALILHLDDVYWQEAGRESIDAVFVALGVAGLLLFGVRPHFVTAWAQSDDGNTTLVGRALSTAVAILVVVVLAAITLLKGKLWTGLLGLFVPVLLLVGAIRVARPDSPWARWRYHPHQRKGEARLARARRREVRYRQPLIRWKIRVEELVGGRPDQPPAPDSESGTGSEPGVTAAADSSSETRTGLNERG